MKKSAILVVAAHPDDEVLGCGATIANYRRKGHPVFCLILGEGVRARDGRSGDQDGDVKRLLRESEKANKILGVRKVFRASFPDNRFDSVALLDIVKAIEDVKRKIKPAIVFTHHAHDVNIDHQLTFKAVLAACRPLPGETVREIYSFYVLSSTDWQAPHPEQSFAPNVFVDVKDTLKLKIKALEAYQSEIRGYPHPRSSKGLRIEAERTGLRVGLPFAESFELLRAIRKNGQ